MSFCHWKKNKKNKTKTRALLQTAVKAAMCVTFRIQEHVCHIFSSAVRLTVHGYS